MKISLEWLGEYVDLNGLDPEHIASELTMKTAEVEKIHAVDYFLDKVVVGEVMSVESVPGYNKLKLLQINLGFEKVNTICGATNVYVGMKAPYAMVGAKLNGGVHVEKKVLAGGYESHGMLCSAKELGLGDYHEIVMDLSVNTPVGKVVRNLIPFNDFLLEIDNKSITHRPDLWGHYGFARELAAIFNRELKQLEQKTLKRFDYLPIFPVIVNDLSLCPGYCCLLLEGIDLVPAPLFMQWRLHAIGQRAINLLVDLTNYIMYEIGQPMHIFDADYVRSVRVATMDIDREFKTLDGQIRKVLSEDLMIWNEREPVALAGIMGGLNSELTYNTNKFLLEVANFHPGHIRRTSIRLGLRSDASQRFEKDLPLAFMPLAIARFLHLTTLTSLMPPQVKSCLSYAGDLGQKRRFLHIPINYVSCCIGQTILPEKIIHILSNIGFGCCQENDTLIVEIPSHRSHRDIGIRQDIIEEIVRFYGYHNIKAKMPEVIITEYCFNELLYAKYKLRRFLAQSRDFKEVYTYSWYDDRWLAKIGYEPNDVLTLVNPIAPYKSKLRNMLMPNLLKVIIQNYAQRDNFRLFEIGQVYSLKNGKSCETTNLAVIIYQAGKITDLESLFLEVKGLTIDVARILGCGSLIFKIAKSNILSWARIKAHLEIWQDNYQYGKLGYLIGPILEVYKDNAQIAWMEIEIEKLSFLSYPVVDVVLPSIFPGSSLDFSILWPTTKSYDMLIAVLDKFCDPLLKKRQFIVAYIGHGLGDGVKSYTFRYWISLDDRTITKSDIDGYKSRFFNFLSVEGLTIR